jgi:hypothetical protein
VPTYIAEYKDELTRHGPARFLSDHPYPVLIVTGVTGTLKAPASSGTVVALASDTVLLGTLVGRVFPIAKGKNSTPGPVRVGRTAENDICIPEYSISKFHCFLAMVGTELRLTDCGSTNGTSVNGRRLAAKVPCALTGGETLVLGRFVFLFHRAAGFAGFLPTV